MRARTCATSARARRGSSRCTPGDRDPGDAVGIVGRDTPDLEQPPRVIAQQPWRGRPEGVDRPTGDPRRRCPQARAVRRTSYAGCAAMNAGQQPSGALRADLGQCGEIGRADILRAVDAGVGQRGGERAAEARPQTGSAERGEDRVGAHRLQRVSGRLRDSSMAGADTSSSASRISCGSSSVSLASAAVSWPSVRAPRIGAVTPGRSRNHASATATGEVARPSAAVATASTTPAAPARCIDGRVLPPTAARESVGTPAAVLAGEHATAERRIRQHADAECQRGGDDLALDTAVEQRVTHLVRDDRRPSGHRALPRRGPTQPPSAVVRHPDVAHLARAHRRVERASVSSKGTVSST